MLLLPYHGNEKLVHVVLSLFYVAKAGAVVNTPSVETKENVLALLKEHQDKIRALGVRRIGLFGSFIRGEHRAESDIDLLVEFEPGKKTFDHFIQLSFFLEDLLNRRVELVTPESLSPYIGPYILSEVEYATFIS